MSEPLPYAALARHYAQLKPDAIALRDDAIALTWRALEQRTNRAAHALIAAGVKPDDLVTLALPNGADFIEACLAIWKAGATPQPVSSRLPRLELEAILDLAKPALVIGNDGLGVSYPTLLARGEHEDAPPLHVAKHGKAPTSGGSTGRPKLILDARPAIADPAGALGWRLDANSIALMPGPLYHNGPFVTAFAALSVGAQLVIMPRFDSEEVLRKVEAHRATWLYLVPTMMSRIWRLDDQVKARYDLSTLETVWHLAAPCPAWLKEAWIHWLGPEKIWELYAASEGIAGTVINGVEWLAHPASVGRVFTGAIKILDENGQEAAPGTIGEIFMRPNQPGVATYEYVGADADIRDGWQSLGDMGHFDEEGFLYLADRRSDMIIVGGANVYPSEVEAAIEAHPLVESCAVIGLPDEDLGARIHAIVQPRGDLSAPALMDHLSERLIVYKRPRTIEFVDAPLRDNAGKVRRSQLRAERMS